MGDVVALEKARDRAAFERMLERSSYHEKLKPIIREGLSDTACLDNAIELLVRSGYSLPHAIMMLIPEAWENHESMSQSKKDFYRYHSCLMEPWDGPASVTFTDGESIGAVATATSCDDRISGAAAKPNWSTHSRTDWIKPPSSSFCIGPVNALSGVPPKPIT